MKDDNIRGVSRRKMLSTTGKLSLLGAMAPAAAAAATSMDYKAEATAAIPPVADMSENPIDHTADKPMAYRRASAGTTLKGSEHAAPS